MLCVKKKLTVAIPTYNRAHLLEDLLRQLCTDIAIFKIENHVEIVISDNFSIDDTSSICDKYSSQYAFVKYYCNDSNLGAKVNVIKSMCLASGEFVLLLGDDDRIRNGCLIEIVEFLNKNTGVSILLDISKSKKNDIGSSEVLPLNLVLENYFWYMGNASVFVFSTDHISNLVNSYGYNFFNQCWPQTQLMILSSGINKGKIYIKNFNISVESKHDEVMAYTSFYLWRTCILELLHSVNTIKNIISNELYNSCRVYIKENLRQNIFNILQCGIFVDTISERKNTRNHILRYFRLFSSYEKSLLLLTIIILSIPNVFSRPLSNIFIFILKGKNGLYKKNNFVLNEMKKKNMLVKKSLVVRELDFE